MADEKCETPVCERCGTEENLEYAPCPYAREINDDHTDVWLCEECRYERAMDV